MKVAKTLLLGAVAALVGAAWHVSADGEAVDCRLLTKKRSCNNAQDGACVWKKLSKNARRECYSTSPTPRPTVAPVAGLATAAAGAREGRCGDGDSPLLLLFILDGSGSVSNSRWEKMTSLTRQIASVVQLGPTASRVAVIEAGKAVGFRSSFISESAADPEHFSNLLQDLKPSGGTSNVPLALLHGYFAVLEAIFDATIHFAGMKKGADSEEGTSEFEAPIDITDYRTATIVMTDGKVNSGSGLCKKLGLGKQPKACAKKMARQLTSQFALIGSMEGDQFADHNLIYVRINGEKSDKGQDALGFAEDLQVLPTEEGLLEIVELLCPPGPLSPIPPT